MDDVDVTQAREQAQLDAKIAEIRRKAKAKPAAPLGECLNECGYAPRPGSAFCSCDCAQDWQHREQTKRKQGLE